jgi:hypothetical protein
MKRRMELDHRGVPHSQSVEYSEEDLQRQRYSLLRLLLFMPLIGLGLAAGAAVETFRWHPMLPIAAGLSVPIGGGLLLHFIPWLRLIYDAVITLVCAVGAFIFVRGLDGSDLIWASGAAFVVVLLGVWMTIADLRGSED